MRPYRRPLFEALGCDRYSYLANDNIDRKLKKYLNFRDGRFVEAGANDGLRASNTYWFERYLGWRGILVEPQPNLAAQCRRNRPLALVVGAALAPDESVKSVVIGQCDLRGYVVGNFAAIGDPAQEAIHRRQSAAEMGVSEIRDVEVPAQTLASILDEAAIGPIDLLSLDVEGYELSALKGMDVRRHRPRFICIETRAPEVICAALDNRYETVEQFGESDYLLRVRQ